MDWEWSEEASKQTSQRLLTRQVKGKGKAQSLPLVLIKVMTIVCDFVKAQHTIGQTTECHAWGCKRGKDLLLKTEVTSRP